MSAERAPGRGAGRGGGGGGAGRPTTVFLSAGEPSGDEHGARLAAELRRRRPDLRLLGLGGPRMAAAGVELLAGLDRLAVLGFAEVVSRLPSLLALRRRVRRALVSEGVDLLVPIDYPGFNLPLAGHARRRGIRVLYYIAPQVWAWRASRARRLARDAELVCAVLPFEAEFLARYGVRAEFVGHPLLDVPRPPGTGAEPGRAPGASPVLALFPGSRTQEVERMLPPFVAAARRLRREIPGLEAVVARSPDVPVDRYGGRAGLPLVEPGEALRRASAALTKSGTITLQLALADVPMVVAYRVSPLTWEIARRLVRVEHVALANLVAGERVVPELLQTEVTPERLAAAAAPLLRPADPVRIRVREGLARVRARLGGPGSTARVAQRCLERLPGAGEEAPAPARVGPAPAAEDAPATRTPATGARP